MTEIGITLGDPAGVGPEILIKSLPHLSKSKAQFLIFGDKAFLDKLSKEYQVSFPQNVEIIDLSNVKVIPGKPSPESHLASIRYLDAAFSFLKSSKIKGLVTLPINKEAFEVAGLPFRGHTEYLAKSFSVKNYGMSFYGKKLKVTLVTTHIPLKEVPKAISRERVLEVAALTYEFIKKYEKIKGEVKIALAGLNPHAGEGGLLGSEEKDVLEPVCMEAKREGIPLYGPYPSDSLFYWALKGRFHWIIALYHDQGLIPFKLLHFRDGVNLTLGLPFPRTSPVHGTAYDIAGKGLADPRSFISAVKLALKIAKSC